VSSTKSHYYSTAILGKVVQMKGTSFLTARRNIFITLYVCFTIFYAIRKSISSLFPYLLEDDSMDVDLKTLGKLIMLKIYCSILFRFNNMIL